MKSLRYMLGGKPHKIDDCIDLSSMVMPSEVSLELAEEMETTESYRINYMVGRYNWKFPNDVSVKCKEYYGCHVLTYDKMSKVETEEANMMLENRLKKLESLGIGIKGKEKRFI